MSVAATPTPRATVLPTGGTGMNRAAHRAGFTLVEMLVVSAVFALVIGMVAEFFRVQAKASTFQKATNEATEAARTALALLTWDLQNAGYRVTVTDRPQDYLGIRAFDDGASDSLVVRYFDESLATPRAQRIHYSLGGEPLSLRRVQFNDDAASAPDEQPTVATVVALNLRYQTRANQYVDLDAGSCPGGTVAVGSPISNCLVPWNERDEAQRLVRQVRVQVLARSSGRVPSYRDPHDHYRFADGSVYATEPGFVYHFAEQTVLSPNLGR